MKILFTIALSLSLSLTGFALPKNHLAELSGVTYGYEKAKVILLEGSGKVKLTILDAKGSQLYQQNVTVKESLTLPLDLKNLPTGQYVIRIENKEGVVEHVIQTSKRQTK